MAILVPGVSPLKLEAHPEYPIERLASMPLEDAMKGDAKGALLHFLGFRKETHLPREEDTWWDVLINETPVEGYDNGVAFGVFGVSYSGLVHYAIGQRTEDLVQVGSDLEFIAQAAIDAPKSNGVSRWLGRGKSEGNVKMAPCGHHPESVLTPNGNRYTMGLEPTFAMLEQYRTAAKLF